MKRRLPWWLRAEESARQCRQGTGIPTLGREDPLEEGSILAWRVQWAERSLAGYSPWSRTDSGTS